MKTIDTDTRKILIQSRKSGERFVCEEAAIWEDDHCIGSIIVRTSGAIHHSELPPLDGMTPTETTALFDLIDQWHCDNDVDEDEWFNQGDAWFAPVGAR